MTIIEAAALKETQAHLPEGMTGENPASWYQAQPASMMVNVVKRATGRRESLPGHHQQSCDFS